MNARLKNALLNGSLLLATIVLFFGGVEVALRMTGVVSMKPNPPRIFQENANPQIRYELRPNIAERAYRATVTTNSLGFRGLELDRGKPLIAVLGDSITFGYGLEDRETIPARLQELLPDVSVLNTAAPGYNIRQQAEVYGTKIRGLRPTVVILIFHPNDLESFGIASLDPQGILRPEGWQPTVEACAPVERGLLGLLPGRCFLDLRSAFYRAVKKFVNARQGQRDLKEQEASLADTEEDPIPLEHVAIYEKHLARLVSFLPSTLPRLFVIWPERYPHSVVLPPLKRIATLFGFTVLDLYEVFGNEPETLGWDTVHPSAETAARAAAIIKITLEEQHFPP